MRKTVHFSEKNLSDLLWEQREKAGFVFCAPNANAKVTFQAFFSLKIGDDNIIAIINKSHFEKLILMCV